MAAAVVEGLATLAVDAAPVFFSTAAAALSGHMVSKLLKGSKSAEQSEAAVTQRMNVCEEDINKMVEHVKQEQRAEFRQQLDQLLAEQQEEREAHSKSIIALQQKLQQTSITSLEDIKDNNEDVRATVVQLVKHTKPQRFARPWNVGVFGVVCAGKSSLINDFLPANTPADHKAKVSYGQSTDAIGEYPCGNRTAFWDVPGSSDLISYLTYDYMSLLKGLDRRVIVVEKSVDQNVNLTRILEEVGLSYCLAINKEDLIEQQDNADQLHHQYIQDAERYCPKQEGLFFISALPEHRTEYDFKKLLAYVAEGGN